MNRIYYKHSRVLHGTEYQDSDLSWIKKGDLVFLCKRVWEDGGHQYFLRPYKGEGYPGNLNHNVKIYHGWRGSTNGVNTYVYGVREILEVGEVKRSGFCGEEQEVKITLSKDLYPDRE